MITKERLEELLEENSTIYTTYGGYVSEINLDAISDYIEGNYLFEANLVAQEINHIQYTFNILFEKKEEAEWVAKIHTSRTEYFEPPFELKDNEKYKFTTAKGGKMSISKFVYKSGEVQWWLSYVGTHRTFYSYQEAVEFARKLFKGEDV